MLPLMKLEAHIRLGAYKINPFPQGTNYIECLQYFLT